MNLKANKNSLLLKKCIEMIYNFYAGPSIIDQSVTQKASQSILTQDELLSIIEISHRSKRFGDLMDELRHTARELMNLNHDFEILFLHGGGRQQFFQIPFNLSEVFKTNYYVDTGNWAHSAMVESEFFGPTKAIASSKDDGYKHIPSFELQDDDAAYVYICTNNTIYGTQYWEIPKTKTPLVADMSSDIFGRSLDFNQFDLFFAATQKNAGTAGACMVCIKPELLKKPENSLPLMVDYRTHINAKSLFNTPPVFANVMSLYVMQWIKEQGGIKHFDTVNHEKAKLLYDELDRNPLFEAYANKKDRSIMNVVFTTMNDQIEQRFLEYTKQEGFVGLNGHRSIGGFRASLYNALPISHVEALVSCMQEFEQKHS